jgi:protein-arginine kinase activator protein McsA
LGIAKERRLVQLKDCKGGIGDDSIIRHWYIPATNATIRARLQAGVCELCGRKDGASYEVHHVPSLKNLNGDELWVQVMKKKHRKTLVVCEDCHMAIHAN